MEEELLQHLGNMVAIHSHLWNAPTIAWAGALLPRLPLGAFEFQPRSMDPQQAGSLHMFEPDAARRNHQDEGHQQLVRALNPGHQDCQVDELPGFQFRGLFARVVDCMEPEVLHRPVVHAESSPEVVCVPPERCVHARGRCRSSRWDLSKEVGQHQRSRIARVLTVGCTVFQPSLQGWGKSTQSLPREPCRPRHQGGLEVLPHHGVSQTRRRHLQLG